MVRDAELGAEVARDCRPRPVVYLAAADAFDLAPAQMLMGAAHSSALAAASAAGLRTAFLARPDEFGAGRGESAAAVPVDLEVASVPELAQALAALR